MCGDPLLDKILQCIECLHQACIPKLEHKLFNGLQILIRRRAANADGRKDFWMAIVNCMLRMNGKLEDHYAIAQKFNEHFQI